LYVSLRFDMTNLRSKAIALPIFDSGAGAGYGWKQQQTATGKGQKNWT